MEPSRQVRRAITRALDKAEAHQAYRAGRSAAKLALKSRRRLKPSAEVQHFPGDPVVWEKRTHVHGKRARPKLLRTRTEGFFRP